MGYFNCMNTAQSWVDFTPDFDYAKEFYDVLLPSGELVKWCWPNAGKMCDIHSGQHREWTTSIQVRLSPDHPLDKRKSSPGHGWGTPEEDCVPSPGHGW